MTSIPNISGAIAAANNQNIAGLVNINLDISLVRCDPPAEFSSIGPALSLHRREEAESGQQHKLACRLGFLFNEIVPETPKLIRAFGTRVSDILRRPGVNPQGTNEDGPFRDFVGADGTSIWAAATSTSASLSVYLLACMLARAWDAKEATAIWVELVHDRKRQVQAQLEQNSIVNPYTHLAILQEFNRPDLARWDASARSWLRRADQCTVFQHTQFKLVIDNIRLPFLDSGTTFDRVTHAWIRSMKVLETLLGNEPQVAFDRSVLLAISSWHLYPNLLVFQEEATNVSFADELFPSLGVLSLGFEYHTPDVQNKKAQGTGLGVATRWSLALSHLRYYGSPVQVRSDENQGERATIDDLWLILLGAILRQWKVSISNLEVSIQWFQKIGDLLNPGEETEKTALSWLSKLCRAAGTIINQHETKRQDRMRFVRFGWRKDTQLLGQEKVLRPPFFGLCNPDVLASLNKTDSTEIGIEFFRRVSQRLNLSPENAIICRSKVDDDLNEVYECATIRPVPAGLDGPRQLEEDGSSLLQNARWIFAEDCHGRPVRSDKLQQRQTSIQRLNERCHIIRDSSHLLDRYEYSEIRLDSSDTIKPPAVGRDWENPPSLFAEDGRSARFIELLSITVSNRLASFTMFVRTETIEHALDLKSQMFDAAMAVNVQEGLNWLEAEGRSFNIVRFLMDFLQLSEPSDSPLRSAKLFTGKKRKRSSDIDADAKSHRAGFLKSDEGRELGCYYAVGGFKSLPMEWIMSLRALEIVSVLYNQLPGATISLRLVDQELFKAKWFPVRVPETDSFSMVVNTSVQNLCNLMTRAHSFACIAMMESGQSNIEMVYTEAVVALCSENSIFVAGILLSDPATTNLGMNIRHLIGNVGHPGIVLMISPSDPSTRSPTYDASMIDHKLYDGKRIDSFKGTSLHLSFTEWKMPLDWDNTGEIDQQVFLLESVISAQDKGRWVADLDVLNLENDGRHIFQFPCDCDRSKPPTDKDIASLDSWEELLDAPPSVGVIRASDNWVARLCAAAILIRKGQGHCVVVTPDEPICWGCMAERYAYTESYLPRFIIN